MKRAVSLLLLLLITAVAVGGAVSSAGAAVLVPYDVVGRACLRDVQKLQYIGVIGGYPDGTFRPDDPIRRAEMAKIVALCRDLDSRATTLRGATRFPDVPADHWAAGFVNAAVETSIIRGYTDGLFRPDRNVSYAELLTMLLRAAGLEPTAGTWPNNVLSAAASLGLTTGITFDRNANATRGDVAMMTSRAVFLAVGPAGTTLGQALGVGREMTVHFVDVGDGDATVVVSPAGNVLVVDAGPNINAPKLVAYIRSLGVQDVDVAVATHAYSDHIGGMDEIIGGFAVGSYYDSGFEYSGQDYAELLRFVAAKGVPYQQARCSMRLEIDPWIDAVVAYPLAPLTGTITTNSVVIKVTMGDVDVLLPGDLDLLGQAGFLSQGVVGPRAEILKVPTHAGVNSVSPAFLAAVDPAVAVVPAGLRNPFGYPAVPTLVQLAQSGATFYRTDLDGTVKVTTNGSTYRIETIPPTVVEPLTGFIGDKSTMTFHLPTCRYLPATQYRHMCATRQLAVDSGYAPCPWCKP